MSKLDDILEITQGMIDDDELLLEARNEAKQQIKQLIKEIYLYSEASRFTTREEFLKRISEL